MQTKLWARALGVIILLTGVFPPPLGAVGQNEGSPNVPDPAEVLAIKGTAVLTQQEIDAAFSKLPEKDRLVFIRDGAKVDQLIRSLLQRKLVAAEATKAGFDRDPLVADRVRLAAEKELAEAWLEHIEAEPGTEVDFEALAYEDYLANPDRYRSEELLDVSHILIGTEDRSAEEARQLAVDLRARLKDDPSQFDSLVMQVSDDPQKVSNAGRYPNMRRGQMVAAFERAAFKLKAPGEISEPVETDFGYHIIRLNARTGNELPPFEKVKAQALQQAEQDYRETRKSNYLKRVLQDPIVIPEGAVEIMAKRYFGENLELAPQYQN